MTKIPVTHVGSLPRSQEVVDFIDRHDFLFVVEQNRDAQLRTLLMAEFEFGPDKLKSVLCFDGTPISARNIKKQITNHLEGEAKPVHRAKAVTASGESA